MFRSFAGKLSSLSIRHVCCAGKYVSPVFCSLQAIRVPVRFSSYRRDDTVYVPFATDFDREHASIMFWVSKNTNLKEVNVNIRVRCLFLLLIL